MDDSSLFLASPPSSGNQAAVYSDACADDSKVRTAKDLPITDTQFQGTSEAYLDAFAATSPDEQERLLRSSVAQDVVYTNPGVEGRGLHNLLKHISLFQERFPGHRFRVNWFRQQHAQMLAEWTQVNSASSPTWLVSGALARYNVPQNDIRFPPNIRARDPGLMSSPI